MKRVLGILAGLWLLAMPTVAWAACAATLTILDGAGVSKTTCLTTDGGTGLVPSIGVLGGTNNANKLNITSAGAIIENSPYAYDAALPVDGYPIGISDGTNFKVLLAPLILGDGVNGNNMLSEAGWLWNGATYDRQYGDKTDGAWVNIKASVPITVASAISTFTNRSGSITSGGVSQTLAASNASRKRIIIENPCSATSQGIATAESLFINFTSAASAISASFELTPCGSFDTGSGAVTSELVAVIAATTGHLFVAKEM